MSGGTSGGSLLQLNFLSFNLNYLHASSTGLSVRFTSVSAVDLSRRTGSSQGDKAEEKEEFHRYFLEINFGMI